MALTETELRQAALRSTITRGQGPQAGQRIAFLCHSHKDRTLAEGLQQLLKDSGLNLYIDWQDAAMPDKPSAETAARLKKRIVDCDLFLFLATENSMSSRWCPWELGYADGKKHHDRIAIVPTQAGQTSHGSEYLDLYRRVVPANGGGLGVFPPKSSSGSQISVL